MHHTLTKARWTSMSTQPDNGREITFGQAINEALAEEMHLDPTVFIIGEDGQLNILRDVAKHLLYVLEDFVIEQRHSFLFSLF